MADNIISSGESASIPPNGDRTIFMDGVRLAADMLDHAERLNLRGCGASIVGEFREGVPQDNFALTFIRQALEQPDLIEGFAAVLSDFLGDQDVQTLAAYYTELRPEQVFDAGA